MSKPTIVLGASPNPERYAYKAALKLQQYGHAVIAIGKREGQMGAVTIMITPTTIKPYYTHHYTLP